MTGPARLYDVIASVFGLEPGALSDDDSPRTIADWDSVNHIHLMMALEAEFSVQFDPGEIADLMSVGALRRRLAGAAEAP